MIFSRKLNAAFLLQDLFGWQYSLPVWPYLAANRFELLEKIWKGSAGTTSGGKMEKEMLTVLREDFAYQKRRLIAIIFLLLFS